jgi:hypothetical protein
MMFIFSIMHNNGSNQLGGPQEMKALTNEGMTLTIFETIEYVHCLDWY